MNISHFVKRWIGTSTKLYTLQLLSQAVIRKLLVKRYVGRTDGATDGHSVSQNHLRSTTDTSRFITWLVGLPATQSGVIKLHGSVYIDA